MGQIVSNVTCVCANAGCRGPAHRDKATAGNESIASERSPCANSRVGAGRPNSARPFHGGYPVLAPLVGPPTHRDRGDHAGVHPGRADAAFSSRGTGDDSALAALDRVGGRRWTAGLRADAATAARPVWV